MSPDTHPSADRGIRRPDVRSRRRTLTTLVAAVLAIVLVAVPAYAVWQLFFADESGAEPGVAVQLEIPAGASTGDIAGILTGAGVIDNAAMFRLRARIDGIDGDLRSGIYDLTTGMGYEDIRDRLLAGPPIDYVTVTIPEGFTVEQIADRLQEQAGIPAEEFLALAKGGATDFSVEHPYLADAYGGSLEGYLFPKTYRIVRGAATADAIGMMLDQFDAEVAGLDTTYASSRGLTLHQMVTLASMIEREARLAEERPLVSSVIYNRLAIGMKLEIDATIEYVIKKNRPRLLNSDLAVESPYNTYKYAGLPPGPIASPGLASLEAAAAPAQTEYIYYVLTGTDGSHTFCVTYEEFLVAKEKSREVTP